MQFTKSVLLLAGLATSTFAAAPRPQGFERRQAAATTSAASSASSSSSDSAWTSLPASGAESTAGFGAVTGSSGSDVTYSGNVGNPYGSNIIQVSASDANQYKYVAQFQGSNTDDWTVAIWNKYSADGTMNGWYGNACQTFTLSAGSTVYIAFDDDSQGGWAAAEGSTIPTDSDGGYASTWGEFDFGSTTNNGWSGFDVSDIQAANAGFSVQGMEICDAIGGTCSSITTDAGSVNNAYTPAETDLGGIGGNLSSGDGVRLAVTIDYSG
ncbi:hypothetical protein N7448_010178 [Penicillium atrosanguineum]|uniref:Allergen Asp f 4 n=1 Tax=Penicillium atrosanguineum TaxID=1132637 RepID=A0A9W9GFW2_9EURO|nr:uncharacterized protein N7443_007402 [Penicillium atrosanguineum]KAJ5118472.1 hypothetical protein N7526_010109 [Penicillium atrosanguineum]KAJ5119509.1 hypothetical protein N7448_010178 [Penicillium atrosanguineum]KAJ5296509.1 hypothetical protein N7443_007402 [Penicillium atrosanguineum]KAJ5299274.1 hypothetical protein N7476_010831 [Penicillium atrosanguineum]